MSTERYPEKEFFTYSDYKHWPDEERWELIDGEAFNMSSAHGRIHQKIVVEITKQLANFLEDKPCEVYSGPFNVFLPEADESEEQTSTIVEPDVSVICDETKLTEIGCFGPPEIVVEVVSPYGRRRDQLQKLYLYERKGVQEYWIVHSIDKLMWRYVRAGKDYGKPEIYDFTGKVKTPVLPGFELDLLKVFGPEPEEIRLSPATGYKPKQKPPAED